MNKFNGLILIILFVISTNILADLKTDRAVINNDGTEQIAAIVSFQESVTGDLYVATRVNGVLLFIVNEGSSFSSTAAPFKSNNLFSNDITVLNVSAHGIPPGRYPLYEVVTRSGADPSDSNNWLGGLHSINFLIGLSSDETQDFDNNGFPDDDLNQDGFSDDDGDRDGFHDGSDIRLEMGATLAKDKGCFDCHTIKTKLVGPAFRDIAKKFVNNSTRLGNIILNGSREETNPITLSEIESRMLADWIFSLK